MRFDAGRAAVNGTFRCAPEVDVHVRVTKPEAAIAKEACSKDTSWKARLVLPLTCP